MTTLEVLCKTLGWHGGTIHQAKDRYAVASLPEQDIICNELMRSLHEISDIETVSYFTSKRLENIRMANIAKARGEQ